LPNPHPHPHPPFIYPNQSTFTDHSSQLVQLLKEENQRLWAYVENLGAQINRLEGFSRRNNLRLFNVFEGDEDVRACARKVVQLLTRFFPCKSWSLRDIERAHRIGPKHDDWGKPRTLIVRFHRWADKLAVLEDKQGRNAMSEELNVRIASDLTDFQQNEIRKHKNEGRVAYYRGGRLHVDERRSPRRSTRHRRSRTPTPFQQQSTLEIFYSETENDQNTHAHIPHQGQRQHATQRTSPRLESMEEFPMLPPRQQHMKSPLVKNTNTSPFTHSKDNPTPRPQRQQSLRSITENITASIQDAIEPDAGSRVHHQSTAASADNVTSGQGHYLPDHTPAVNHGSTPQTPHPQGTSLHPDAASEVSPQDLLPPAHYSHDNGPSSEIPGPPLHASGTSTGPGPPEWDLQADYPQGNNLGSGFPDMSPRQTSRRSSIGHDSSGRGSPSLLHHLHDTSVGLGSTELGSPYQASCPSEQTLPPHAHHPPSNTGSNPTGQVQQQWQQQSTSSPTADAEQGGSPPSQVSVVNEIQNTPKRPLTRSIVKKQTQLTDSFIRLASPTTKTVTLQNEAMSDSAKIDNTQTHMNTQQKQHKSNTLTTRQGATTEPKTIT